LGQDRDVSADPHDRNNSLHQPVGVSRLSKWDFRSMEAAKALPLPKVNLTAVREAGRAMPMPAKIEGSRSALSLGVSGRARIAGDVGAFPFKWAGVLFYNILDGTDRYCSAQFISPRVVLTAAHCVRDNVTGKWYSDFAFALQYRQGKSSTQFGWKCVATKEGWVQRGEGKWLYDYAMLLIDGTSPTGHFATAWNWGRSHNNAHKIGYPGGVSEGEIIQVYGGPISVSDGIVEMRHGNKANQDGSSGGAFIAKYSTAFNTQSNVAISNEAFGYDETPGVDYGPYYTNAFAELFQYVERGCR
jgi:hypothetical protein